jgi:hypothetical protein
MGLAACISSSCLDRDELTDLRWLEASLARHPYMRADLGAKDSLSKELEAVVSCRLAWLHSEGVRNGTTSPSLLSKLRSREAELTSAMTATGRFDDVLLRYETILLLHPEPAMEPGVATIRARLAHAVERWESARRRCTARSALAQKWQQSVAFFRHGALLPWYWVRRRRIRARMPRVVVDQPALRETLFAIEQIGPLVDNFAFGGVGALGAPISVALADVTFLYMQLADEFLDELAAAAGGHGAVGRLIESLYRAGEADRPLRALSLDHVRTVGVDPLGHSTKFGLTLARLFEVLDQLARTIDALLLEVDRGVIDATHHFLHHCFQTYLDEVHLRHEAPGGRPDRMRMQDTAWHFYRKNNLVMMLWLDLRARLLGLDPARHADAIRRWGYLLASFQIFDDLKDIAVDLGKQPNYALQIAADDFPRELAWIEGRFGHRRVPMTRDDVAEMSLRARKTVQQCMSWSRFIALAHFDNVLLYAWDQRWRKSWTRRRNSLNPESAERRKTFRRPADRLIDALGAMRHDGHPATMDDSQLAFALDLAAYEGVWRIHLALFPNIVAMYRLATLQMWMTAEEKARIARRLLCRRVSRARATVLLGLVDRDVDHEVASDGLEAFSKVIEA